MLKLLFVIENDYNNIGYKGLKGIYTNAILLLSAPDRAVM